MIHPTYLNFLSVMQSVFTIVLRSMNSRRMPWVSQGGIKITFPVDYKVLNFRSVGIWSVSTPSVLHSVWE
jgi:hypothetical protein